MYTMASMAFVAAVVACGRSPSKSANVPLPPEKAETLAAWLHTWSFLLDVQSA